MTVSADMGALGWLSIRLRILHTWAFKVFIVIYSYSHVIRLSLMHRHYIFSRPSWPPMYFSHILFVYIHIHVVHTHIHTSLIAYSHTYSHTLFPIGTRGCTIWGFLGQILGSFLPYDSHCGINIGYS